MNLIYLNKQLLKIANLKHLILLNLQNSNKRIRFWLNKQKRNRKWLIWNKITL